MLMKLPMVNGKLSYGKYIDGIFLEFMLTRNNTPDYFLYF